MEVAVWDTYVKRKDGRIMHFDIIAPMALRDASKIHQFGHDYLLSKNEESASLSSRECKFCHIEQCRPEWEKCILNKGYFIFEMSNCD